MLEVELALLVAGLVTLIAGFCTCLHDALWRRWSP